MEVGTPAVLARVTLWMVQRENRPWAHRRQERRASLVGPQAHDRLERKASLDFEIHGALLMATAHALLLYSERVHQHH